jgi:hypothetical protein
MYGLLAPSKALLSRVGIAKMIGVMNTAVVDPGKAFSPDNQPSLGQRPAADLQTPFDL